MPKPNHAARDDVHRLQYLEAETDRHIALCHAALEYCRTVARLPEHARKEIARRRPYIIEASVAGHALDGLSEGQLGMLIREVGRPWDWPGISALAQRLGRQVQAQDTYSHLLTVLVTPLAVNVEAAVDGNGEPSAQPAQPGVGRGVTTASDRERRPATRMHRGA